MVNSNQAELARTVESATNLINVSEFLIEIINYFNRDAGTDGGITGLNRVRYDLAKKSGKNYSYRIDDSRNARIDLRSYAPYQYLKHDDLAAMFYCVGYIEMYVSEIPREKHERFKLFNYLFDSNAQYEQYMKG